MKRRIAAAATAIGALAAALVIAAPPPASAHTVLVRSDPMSGQRLDTPPTRVLLIFSEPVFAAEVTVLDAAGQPVTAGEPGFVDPAHRQVSTPLRADLGTGGYVVSWRAISADVHLLRDEFGFGVRAAAPATAAGSGSTTAGLVGLAHPVLRWLGFAGIAVVIGGLGFLLVIWPPGLRRRQPRLLVVAGAVAALAGSIGQLLLQAQYTDRSVIATVTSEFGYLLLARIALLAIGLLVIAVLLDRPRWQRLGRIAAVGVAAAALLTWPLTGHARAADPAWLGVGVDAVHLGAVAFWLGGVVMLLTVVLREPLGRTEAAALVAPFSPLALGAVTVIAATGGYQAWREVGTPAALLSTDYGLLLVAKIGLFAVLIGLALVARRWLRGRFAAGPGGLRRSLGVEVAVAAVILALSSVLAATPPARTTYSDRSTTTVDSE